MTCAALLLLASFWMDSFSIFPVKMVNKKNSQLVFWIWPYFKTLHTLYVWMRSQQSFGFMLYCLLNHYSVQEEKHFKFTMMRVKLNQPLCLSVLRPAPAQQRGTYGPAVDGGGLWDSEDSEGPCSTVWLFNQKKTWKAKHLDALHLNKPIWDVLCATKIAGLPLWLNGSSGSQSFPNYWAWKGFSEAKYLLKWPMLYSRDCMS